MQIPLIAGISADSNPALRIAYPVNMIQVPGQDGIADGYLRPAEGILPFTTGQGVDRGGIVWTGGDGNHYRVSGSKLVRVAASGVVTVIGDVDGGPAFLPVRMDFSTTLLGILSGGFLWFYDGATLTKCTDPNIPANLVDMVWVDGYFMVTDGVNIAVSNLAAPATFNPLKFGTTDRPDPVVALIKILNEVHVVSRNFIDVFENVGTSLFPFQRVNTAVITRGAAGTRACCAYGDSVAFIGGGRRTATGEAFGIYRAHNGRSEKISSVEIDMLLQQSYTTNQLAASVMESVTDRGSEFLYVHLPDRTIVYNGAASDAAQQPVWFNLVTTMNGFSAYRGINMTRASYTNQQNVTTDAWIVGDPQSSAIGVWTSTDSQHFGAPTRWEFSTPILRNDGFGAILHRLELFALTGSPGNVPAGKGPMVSLSSSFDNGMTFGEDFAIPSGRVGDRNKRLVWLRQGLWRNSRILRFRGDSTSRLTALRLDATIQGLAA